MPSCSSRARIRDNVSGCNPVLRFNPSNVNMVKSSVSISAITSASRPLKSYSDGRLSQLTFRIGTIVLLNCPNVSFEYYPNSMENAMMGMVNWSQLPFFTAWISSWIHDFSVGFSVFACFSVYIVYIIMLGIDITTESTLSIVK